MDRGLQSVLDALPEDGTAIEFSALREAVPAEFRQSIQQARRAGVAVFTLETDENGNTTHMVRRAS